MLSAVYFDNQPRSMAGEVDDILTNGNLAAEAPVRKSGAEQGPYFPLCIGHFGAELACSPSSAIGWNSFHGATAPLPLRLANKFASLAASPIKGEEFALLPGLCLEGNIAMLA